MRAAGVLFCALLASPVLAQADDGICGGPLRIGEQVPLSLMRVKADAPARLHFVQDSSQKKGCPASGEACQRRGFVVPGDEVVAGPIRGDFVCVTYIAPNPKRVKGKFTETDGFLPKSALVAVEQGAPAITQWPGTWLRSTEADIVITREGADRLKIFGEATFGAQDPERIKRGAVNMGEMSETAKPIGNRLAFGEGYTDPAKPFPDMGGECLARLTLLGRYLVAEDNLGCGGMNVTFNGVYARGR